MKTLAVALLIANVALFGWLYSRHVDRVTAAAVTREPLPRDAPPLTLVAEMEELPELKEPEPRPGPAVDQFSEVHEHVERADRCLDIGPFASVEARDRVRDWLREYIAVLNTRSETVRKRQFFWVYLEPTSEQAAQQNLSDLQQRGVEDYMLIRRGDLKNAISLGLFRSQDSVNRRLAELSEKGYKPVVVPRFETTDRFWIRAQLAEAYGSDLELPAELLGEAAARDIACDTVQAQL